ncbi:Tip elongation aberrant protein 1 [Fulvia fulva]|uniref:Tip elongation aberrant protein 1 n=1 Tax=Passalora fulva TaxID=5499 RepID=A0A9Q8PM43_PASFU|nr:Tip elongation aberrant protein 1 [Fulvia fulva]UJO24961.1 Tip elongation aberrant protein 1 [Fulvia fulva]
MSFLFKSSKQKGASGPNVAPTSAAGMKGQAGGITTAHITAPNGMANTGAMPASPTPAKSVNSSLNSIDPKEKPGIVPRAADDRVVALREDTPQRGPPSPEQKSLREDSRSNSRENSHRMQVQGRPSPDQSPYPWSQRRLNFTVSHTNPFPRYGAAVNATSSKDGSIYLMGGLINGSTVKGDLWMVEAGSPQMTCFPVATTSEGPGPRVGHASLLVGNAFIVFGGDTKMDEGDMLDDTLYLLNTSTKQWSRALPAGPRPPGRYGHTLNILGSKIYIFGGQVEGYFFNDLVAFDLNALQQATNKWEVLIQNTIDGGPPHGQIPPARTNHTMITWGDKLYLFGGTDGVQWFNDVWSYSPHSNSWTQQECIGYIPAAREGHAASLVGDVMYIFGGRTEEGTDLGDLAAFRISSRRWYTFQNMGPSPSPRSGHSMTTVGKQIMVLAGEPSSAPRDPIELGLAYVLDTSKIRYPPDSASQQSSNERIQGTRRPSGERVMSPAQQNRGPPRELMERERSDSANRIRSPDGSRPPQRLLNQLPAPAPTGPPPQAPRQAPNGTMPAARQPTRPQERAFSPNAENERPQRFENTIAETTRDVTVPQSKLPTSPTFDSEGGYYDNEPQPEPQPTRQPATYQPPQTYQPSQQPQASQPYGRTSSRAQQTRQPERFDETPRPSTDTQDAASLPKVRQLSEEPEGPQDSGIGSSPALVHQHDQMQRELEQVKKQNEWYASELALARKAGYQARSAESPVFDERAGESFGEDDRPLIEALLKMRAELARVQETIDEQAKQAGERIAQIEKERDTAINEAVFAKAKLAGQGSLKPDGDSRSIDRSDDISRRLASSIEAQRELSTRIDGLIREVETEKRLREQFEDTANAAQARVAELDAYRQQNSAQVESLKAELHEAQREAREATANHNEILSQHRLLSVDKDELSRKLEDVSGSGESHTSMLMSLRSAVTASTEKADLLERQLEEERGHKSDIERSLRELRSQHESRSAELGSVTRRLRGAEELAQKHAEEARTHREAVIVGLGKISEREVNPAAANDERITILQEQVEAANAMVRQNQAAADAASEKLRRAEERIAGLEAYQEQASREGLSIRKQLSTTMKENQILTAEKSVLEQKLERHMLETNALSVQYGSLKDILGDRGVSAAEKRRSRALDSPSSARFSTPDLHRVRDLEQQLENSQKNHEELKQHFEEINERSDKTKRDYEEKLTALDNDHQAAVKYLRGTEKMLSKMKQELQRVKNENGDLKKKLDKAKDDVGTSRQATPDNRSPAEWEAERTRLREEFATTQSSLQTSVAELEKKIDTMQEHMQSTERELQQARTSHTSAQSDLKALQESHTSSRSDIERLQKENSALEERAKDAENKVQLLLDQVESSVDNYRRQSRMSASTTPVLNGTAHARPPSISEASEASQSIVKGHTRNTSGVSASGDSNYSGTAHSESGEGRNSMALDSLASELDALRTHWETTNKNYRLSDKFDFERTLTATSANTAGGLADWRRGLEIDDDDETRPGTSEGASTSKGSRDSREDMPTPTAAQATSGLNDDIRRAP